MTGTLVSPTVVLERVTKRYGETTALDRVTATIVPGSFVAVIGQRTDTLSGGEQQRVAIAKVLAQEPALILGDEPVASLDVMNGALVMATLRDVATRAGLTVIATLHHVDYARRYADRILGLRGGRLVFDGAPEALTDAALVDIFGERPEDVAPAPAFALPAPAWLRSVAS